MKYWSSFLFFHIHLGGWNKLPRGMDLHHRKTQLLALVNLKSRRRSGRHCVYPLAKNEMSRKSRLLWKNCIQKLPLYSVVFSSVCQGFFSASSRATFSQRMTGGGGQFRENVVVKLAMLSRVLP